MTEREQHKRERSESECGVTGRVLHSVWETCKENKIDKLTVKDQQLDFSSDEIANFLKE